MSAARPRRRITATKNRGPRPGRHPVTWVAPVAGALTVMAAWAGVAHSSGSGWVQAVGALLAAVLLVGMVVPALLVGRVAVVCTANPADGETGAATRIALVADGPVRIRPIAPPGPVARAEGAASGPRTVDVELRPTRRGVLESVTIEVATCAPFGLLWWARDLEVPLVRPLHVAPRADGAEPLELGTDDIAGDAEERIPVPIGEPRGVRPYATGDPRRLVHWPVTSHTGSLMVRESEGQRDRPVTVELVLPSDPEGADAAAERTMGQLSPVLASGLQVILCTDEPTGPVTGWVRDRTDLGRRLARAVPPAHRRPHLSADGASTDSGRDRHTDGDTGKGHDR